MAIKLTDDQLRRLARLGAQQRIDELRAEEAAIRRAFPNLAAAGGGGRGRRGRKAAGAAGTQTRRRRRKRRKMTAAEKRAVSERMKKYWAERRKGR